MTLYDLSLHHVIPLSSGGPFSVCVSDGGGAGVLLVHGGGTLGGPGVRVGRSTMSSQSWAKSCSGVGCEVLRATRSGNMSMPGCSVVLSGVGDGVGGESCSVAVPMKVGCASVMSTWE